jgi:uncharacterized membrane protein
MKDLFVIGFDTEEAARGALASLRSLEKEGRIHFEDTAVVTRGADGKAHVKNEASAATEVGAGLGAGLAMLIGGLLFPVVGIAIGAAIGAVTGQGVDGRFVKEVEATLKPGTSALFIVTQQVDQGLLVAALRQHSGRVIQTTVDPELEAALADALKG